MKKGITPVVAVVLLLIIAVAVVGMGYAFISGFFSTVAGKAAVVSGLLSCETTTGDVTVVVTNAGTETITKASDVVIVAKSCDDTAGLGCTATTTGCPTAGSAEPGTSMQLECTAACPTLTGGKCTFDVSVAGALFPTVANC